jgi:hypothetical protein
MNPALLLRRRLVETAAGLADEYGAHPAGSVLRCYARAVRLMRRAGCGDDELPAAARRAAVEMLSARRVEEPLRLSVIPRQRRPGWAC